MMEILEVEACFHSSLQIVVCFAIFVFMRARRIGRKDEKIEERIFGVDLYIKIGVI